MQQGGAESLPGRPGVRAEDIISALGAAANRKGEKAIAKLKGLVFLVGEIAERGFTDGPVEFAVTVKSDQQVIVNALPEYAAQNKLRFRVLAQGEAPPQPSIPVNGGEG
jgi:hypothetical protein